MVQTKEVGIVTMNAEKLAAICDSFVMVTCFSMLHSTGMVPQSSERGLTISTGPTPSQATCTICSTVHINTVVMTSHV